MSNSSLPEAVDTTASDAAVPTSSSPAPGVQETPDTPVTDMQIVSSDPTAAPTLVDAKPIAPLPPYRRTIRGDHFRG
ncbi:MAG TPA: hypothetical protein VFE47_01340 [Tepidisphaeraceae bacterium]|jgi:hypothetical protein|nr:hypothetical protein [Tepidisphaeraceae bacterium]